MDKKEMIKYEKKLYFPKKGYYYISKLMKEYEYLTFKYVKLLRQEEYAKNKISRHFFRYLKNNLGEKLGFTIPMGVFESGLHIWHIGNVVINGNARVGKNCVLHGDNCIGNDGITSKAPVIGNNVDIGIGAKIIGDVYIADGVKIGAGAIVVKSCYNKNATLIGVPAKEK